MRTSLKTAQSAPGREHCGRSSRRRSRSDHVVGRTLLHVGNSRVTVNVPDFNPTVRIEDRASCGLAALLHLWTRSSRDVRVRQGEWAMTEVRIAYLNKNDHMNPRTRIVPTYPPDAVANHVEDVVSVALTIGANGRVADTRLVRSVPELDEAVVDAVRDWEFSPPPEVVVGETQTVAMQFSLS